LNDFFRILGENIFSGTKVKKKSTIKLENSIKPKAGKSISSCYVTNHIRRYLNPRMKKMQKETLFRNLIDENGKKIFRICCWYFADNEERNDAYQETLIRIWEQLHSFREESNIKTWIYRVTVNTCLSGIRSEKRRRNCIDKDVKVENIEMMETPQDKETDHDKKLAFFHRFLETLGVSDRTLVSLYLEDLSTREMAEVTGLSETNVRVRIFRIKEQVKKEWEGYNYGIG